MRDPRLKAILKPFIYLCTFAVCAFVLLKLVNIEDLGQTLKTFQIKTLTLAFLFLSLSSFVSSIRYWSVLKTFQQKINFSQAFRATAMGAIGSLVMFQVVGQTLSRWQILRREGVSGVNVMVTTFYERLLAAIILGLVASAAVVYLYGGIQSQIVNAVVIQKAFITLSICACLVGIVILRPYLTKIFQRLNQKRFYWSVARDSILTLTVHILMLGAYISLILSMKPDSSVLQLAAAGAVVMFAASIPISFAGWGVRELSAVLAFQHVGVPESQAVAASMIVGFLSLVVVGVFGLAAFWQGVQQKGDLKTVQETNSATQVDYSALILKGVPILIAILIFFNIPVPLKSSLVMINLADPLALVSLGLMAIYWRRERMSQLDRADWRWLYKLGGALLLLIGLGLSIGYSRFGFTSWAVVNRGLGTILVLAFLSAGFLAGRLFNRESAKLIPQVIMWTILGIILADVGFSILDSMGFKYFHEAISQYGLKGEAQNSNAFGFQILMGFCCLSYLSQLPNGKSIFTSKWIYVIGFIYAFSAYMTMSRTTAIIFIAISVLGFLFRFQSRQLTLAVLTAIAAVALLRVGQSYIEIENPYAGMGKYMMYEVTTRSASDGERWQSISSGLEMLKRHPLLGGGIGAYMAERKATGQSDLVIHSTFIWLLAELGIFGFGLICSLFLALLAKFVQKFRKNKTSLATMGILILVVYGLFGLPHDIFYQRSFWFLLGFCLPITSDYYFRAKTETSRHPKDHIASSAYQTCVQ